MLNKIIYTIFGIGVALIFFPHTAKDSNNKPAVSGIAIQKNTAIKSSPEMAISLPSPDLTAKSALALDLDSKTILYSKNLDYKLPIASLTKLMTAIVVSKYADPNSVVTIKKKETNVVGASIGLTEGEQITVGSLLQSLLISSSNDSALALGDFVGGNIQAFALKMNQEAESLGLNNTHFANPVGWDSDENFSDALDLTKIVQEFLKYDSLRNIVKIKETKISSVDGKYTHELLTTNKLLLENPEVEGIKTGFTSKALGNLIIMINHNNNRIVTIVLGSENREDDSQKLIDWLLQVYKW